MDWKLEVVIVPVSDVDKAKEFYRDRLGFVEDLDSQVNPGTRIVQLTPPGSGCSVIIGTGLSDAAPGSYRGLQLVVADIEAARAELVGRGFDPGPVMHVEPDGTQKEGKGGAWNSFLFFADPDGNTWAVQERPAAEA